MARVFGTPGRFVSGQVVTKLRSVMSTVFVSVALLSATGGLLVGMSIWRGRGSPWLDIAVTAAMALAVTVVWRWSVRRIDVLERERLNMRRGADGEFTVAAALANFPDEFIVINDVTTPLGNLDHVVIGPTGVFLVDTKNWRGIVSADGKGELLLNQHPTDKPFVRQFVGRVMAVKDRISVLVPEFDPYFQAVFVFTSARVDASWGSTGKVHCIRDDQLFDYIIDKDFGTKLGQSEVACIARALLALARLDTGFLPASASQSESEPQIA